MYSLFLNGGNITVSVLCALCLDSTCGRIQKNFYFKSGEALTANKPFLSSKTPHFENEAKCKTFLVIMSLICMRIKDQFHLASLLNRGLNQLGTEMARYHDS